MSMPPRSELISDSQVNRGIQYVKHNSTVISSHDKRVWEIVADAPSMKKKYAYGCALANVVISGSGTMVCAFLDDTMNKTQFIVGIMQLMLSPYLIGYLWSLWWAYKFIMATGRPSQLNSSAMSTAEGAPQGNM